IGPMGFTPDQLPAIGLLRPRVIVVAGFNGYGGTYTTAAREAAALLSLARKEPEWGPQDVFPPRRVPPRRPPFLDPPPKPRRHRPFPLSAAEDSRGEARGGPSLGRVGAGRPDCPVAVREEPVATIRRAVELTPAGCRRGAVATVRHIPSVRTRRADGAGDVDAPLGGAREYASVRGGKRGSELLCRPPRHGAGEHRAGRPAASARQPGSGERVRPGEPDRRPVTLRQLLDAERGCAP